MGHRLRFPSCLHRCSALWTVVFVGSILRADAEVEGGQRKRVSGSLGECGSARASWFERAGEIARVLVVGASRRRNGGAKRAWSTVDG